MRLLFKYFLLVVLIYNNLASQAQQVNLDSLQQLLTELKVDTTRARVLNQLSHEYWHKSLDTAQQYAEAALALVEEKEGRNYKIQQAEALNNLGIVNWYKGQYPQAMKVCLKSLNIYEELDIPSAIATTQNSIANIYAVQKEYREAIRAYDKVVEASLRDSVNSKIGLVLAYSNIAGCYQRLDEPDQALAYSIKAMNIAKTLENNQYLGNNLMEIGNSYVRLGEFDQAKPYLMDALEILQKNGNPYYLTFAYYNLSVWADSLGNTEEAIAYGNTAYQKASTIQAKHALVDITALLARNYYAKEQFQTAYDILDEMTGYKDSLFTETKKQEVHNLELARKDAIITLEHQEAELQQANSDRKTSIIVAITGALFSAVILAGLFFRGRQREKSVSSKLAEQQEAILRKNEELQQQSEQITKSINAAQTIQQAMLPFHARVVTYLPNYFVLYEPKDIVSGDFYWINQIEDTTVIAVVDCTGHGIPGAFMSMIGNTLLDEIITADKNTNPAKILTDLNQQVIRLLNQENSRDVNGMDVALVALKDQGAYTEVTFSGAKRPLFYYDAMTNALEVQKGTKKAIGGRQNEKVFENHSLQLPKGSMIYLATDGYEDQHNAENRKIGRLKMIELLEEQSANEVAEQQENLKAYLSDYMEGVHQRDDILLIGARL